METAQPATTENVRQALCELEISFRKRLTVMRGVAEELIVWAHGLVGDQARPHLPVII